jgi:hypothetical protein
MYMVHRGMTGNNLYLSAYRGNAWGTPGLINGAFSRVTPGLGVFNDRLFMVYPHVNTNRYMMSMYDGNGWSAATAIGSLYGNSSPALGFYGGRLNMIHRGLGNNQLYLSRFDGNRWDDAFGIPGAFSRVTPSVVSYGNRFNLLYPGLGNNRLTLHAFDGNLWGNPTVLGLSSPWSPGIGVYNNAINAVYPTALGGGYGGYGVGSGYGLGWTAYDGNAWGPGTVLGGFRTSLAPSLGFYGNRMHMVYPGADNQYYHSYLNDDGYGDCNSCYDDGGY